VIDVKNKKKRVTQSTSQGKILDAEFRCEREGDVRTDNGFL
jgi:hypothetical protein